MQPVDGRPGVGHDPRNVNQQATMSNGNLQTNGQTSLARHLPQTARRLAAKGLRRARELSYLLRPRYRAFPDPTGLSLEHHSSLPLLDITASSHLLRHSFDFLPDKYTLSGISFSDSPHLDFAKRYLHESDFDHRKTDYYNRAVRGHLAFPCRGNIEAEVRCRRFIALIHDLQNEGYKPEEYGAICLAECIDGSFIVLNGKHRLAALLALGIKTFPVAFCPVEEVRARLSFSIDRLWPLSSYQKTLATYSSLGDSVDNKETEIAELRSYIRNAHLHSQAEVYHPIPFFEFRDMSSQVHPAAAYGRLGMLISQYPDFQGLRVLDLGCNIGFYSFSLARRGADVTALDTRAEFIKIAQQLSDIYDFHVDFKQKSVTPEIEGEYDLVLCFSMLQWVISQNGEEYGRRVLRSLSDRSKAMIFDVAVNVGKECLRCKPGEELIFVRRLLSESTTFENIVYVGDVHPYGVDTRHVFFCSHASR